jgi:hypothetical protein
VIFSAIRGSTPEGNSGATTASVASAVPDNSEAIKTRVAVNFDIPIRIAKPPVPTKHLN